MKKIKNPVADFYSAELTMAERLVLWRRRAGMTQDRAAAVLDCGRTTYSRMESGERQPPANWRNSFERFQSEPTRQERLFLARRRSGLTLAKIAADLGTSRVTVLKMERAGDRRLLDYWKNK